MEKNEYELYSKTKKSKNEDTTQAIINFDISTSEYTNNCVKDEIIRYKLAK